MNDRITALEEALKQIAEQTKGVTPEPDNLQMAIGSIHSFATSALAASRAAPDCHQPDLVTANPAERAGWNAAIAWVENYLADYVSEHGNYDHSTGVTEFPDGGEWAGSVQEIIDGMRLAMPAAIRAAPDCHQPDLVTAAQSLRITGPNSDGEYWLHINAGGRTGGINLGSEHGPICNRLLDAASADASLDLTPAPAVEPVATNTMVEPVATPHECATEGCGKLAAVHFIRGNIGSYYCMDCYLRVHKQTHPALRAIGGDA